MDKVLCFDGYNALHRANIKINFGSKAPKEEWGTEPQPEVKEEKPDYVMTFNFFRNLRPLIEMFKPDKVFFVLEGHSKSRYELYPEYKANRIIKYAAKKEEKEQFNVQKDRIIGLLKHFPITTVLASDYEADDVIHTLCQDLRQEDLTVVTNDSDFIQLLQMKFDNLKIYNPIKKDFMTAPDYHYVAWKSLAGDKSDNIKSLVGDKKAQTLVTTPDKFQKFLELEENRANFNINKALIEFQTVPADQLIVEEGKPDWNQVKSEFQKMEFESITNDKSWQKYKSTFDTIKY